MELPEHLYKYNIPEWSTVAGWIQSLHTGTEGMFLSCADFHLQWPNLGPWLEAMPGHTVGWRKVQKDVRFFDKTWWTVGNTGPRETSTTGNSCGVFLDLLFPCRLATYSRKRPRIQLFGAVGWQPTAIKGLGCSYLTL